MSRREDVDNAIWGDPVFEALTADSKLLYLWSFTNPLCNMAGLYRASDERMQRETRLTPQRWGKAVEELRAAGMLFYEQPWLWVRSRVKYLRTKSPAMAQSIIGDVGQLDTGSELRHRFVDEYGELAWLSEKGGDRWNTLVDSTRSVEPNPGRVPRGSMEGPLTLQGRATAGQGRETPAVVAREPEGFEDWLAHHEATTGMQPPKPGTQARQKVAGMFGARMGEGYSLADLKLATEGAFKDEYRREHGHYGHVSVLRPEKVHDLIEKGRRGGAGKSQASRVYDLPTKCRRCGAALEELGKGSFCRPCDEIRAGEAA